VGALAGINRGRSARATGLFYRSWVTVMFHGSAGQQSRLCRLLPGPLTPPLPIPQFVLASATLCRRTKKPHFQTICSHRSLLCQLWPHGLLPICWMCCRICAYYVANLYLQLASYSWLVVMASMKSMSSKLLLLPDVYNIAKKVGEEFQRSVFPSSFSRWKWLV